MADYNKFLVSQEHVNDPVMCYEVTRIWTFVLFNLLLRKFTIPDVRKFIVILNVVLLFSIFQEEAMLKPGPLFHSEYMVDELVNKYMLISIKNKHINKKIVCKW